MRRFGMEDQKGEKILSFVRVYVISFRVKDSLKKGWNMNSSQMY